MKQKMHINTITDSIINFRNEIMSFGLVPPDVVEPGKLHRFPGLGKRPGNKAGWCRFFDDGMAGCFGDWSTGLSEIWRSQWNNSSSRLNDISYINQIRSIVSYDKYKQKEKHASAERKASAILKSSTFQVSNHPYLIRKMIKVNGAKLYKGSLVLPIISFKNTVTSLQFIRENGSKVLLSGGRKKGCFIHVAGNMNKPTRVIICEGWATGCTLAEDDSTALVLAAIDAGNLKPVAVSARHRWPSTELIIAGDDDRLSTNNPGATKAKSAAIASGALLAFPQWPAEAPTNLSDFNDLTIWLAGDLA